MPQNHCGVSIHFKVIASEKHCSRVIRVAWFKYGAKSCCKVVNSRLVFAMRGLENSVTPAVKGYLFQIEKDKA